MWTAVLLALSPPLDMKQKWFAPHVAYTSAKFGMSLCILGWAGEFKGKIAANAIWPRTAIDTAAINVITGPLTRKLCRSVDIMADAAHWVLSQPPRECTGQTFIDDEIIAEHFPATDLDSYRADTSMMARLAPLLPDFYVGDPASMEKYVDMARAVQKRL